MQAIYYPTKIPVTARLEEEDLAELDNRWYIKAKRLTNRRWKKIEDLENSEKELRQKRFHKMRQAQWMQRHAWNRIAQPLS
jgi:hypothetical protein